MRLGRNLRQRGPRNQKPSLQTLARTILRSFGSNASSYPFSTLSGAYQTSAGPAAAAVNDPIGLELDTLGTRTDLTVSQDLTAWTSGGAFENWAGSTATATTITALGAFGSRYMRFACSPGNLVQFSSTVVAGSTPGMIQIVFGSAGATYLSEVVTTSIASGAISAGGIAPALTAFVEIIIRAVDAGGTVGFTGLSAFQVTGNHATNTTAINRPTVQQEGNGRFYASFNGTNSSLALSSVPFQTNDDFCVVACVKPTGVAAGGVFTLSTAGDTTAEYMTVAFAAGKAEFYMSYGGSSADIQSPSSYADQAIVMTAWKVGTAMVLRVNSVQVGVNTWAGGTSAYTVCTMGKYPGLWLPHANYGIEPIKGTLTLAQVVTLEKAAAQRAGLVL